ncbi:trypsin-like serine peptidase [Pseudomonas japonica]|uniref:trypsin-like serine peptidase n=1 Tax=Pseudomonas japonica TaxID=256466 RepID=UPI0038096742
MKLLPTAAALWVLYTPLTWSDPLNEPAPKDVVLAPLLSAHDVTSERFFAVGQLKSTIGIGWSCTATLVAGSDTPDPQKPALILTAGHCAAGTTGDNEVVMDRPMGEGWFFTPSYFHDNKDQHVRIPIVRILYSTMKSTDVGVLQLGETWGEVLAKGFKPMRLRAIDGAIPDIDIAHIPIGLFRDHYLRYSECSSRQPVALFETLRAIEPRKDMPWFWPRATPNPCIGLYGGSSGSPIFARGEWAIIGVHSTGLREEGCGSGKPCEIEGGQPVGKLGTSYFASTERLLEAFKADGSFDASSLDPGTGIVIHRQGNGDSVPIGPEVAGERRPVRWGMLIDEAFESIRYKIGPADETPCEQPKGYGEEESVLKQPLMDLATPMVPGVYALCAVGKRPGSTQWQPWAQATVKLLRVE